VQWRALAWTFLAALIALDLLSMALHEASLLTGVRFMHGAVGGALVGLSYSIMARTQNPDRTFGVLLIVQFGLGGVGLLVLPPLVPQLGSYVLFLALIMFSVAAALMLRFLPDYAASAGTASNAPARASTISYLLLFALLSIFLFQAANMGLTAFVIEIARSAGLGSAETGMALAVANWLGIAGAAIVVMLPARCGRKIPLAVGMALTALATWCLHFSGEAWIYFAANAVVAITWAMVIAYLLGMCAQFKSDGRVAVIGGFVSKMGLASGPAAFALASGAWSYSTMIDVSVVGLVISGLVCLIPAAHLDRQRQAVAADSGSL
jgi:hypothetical protein